MEIWDPIHRKSSNLYPLIFEINAALDLSFPRIKVLEILETLGFRRPGSISSPRVMELRSDHCMAYVTGRQILFTEDMPSKEWLHAQLFNLLVTRVRILNQAAVQNSEAAKLNLLQNQRRASVSDAYYALFTSIGSLIQYLKDSIDLCSMFPSIEDGALETDLEDQRNHMTPDEARKVASRFSKVAQDVANRSLSLESETIRFSYDVNEKLSRRNTFLWGLIALNVLFEKSGSNFPQSTICPTNSNEIVDEEADPSSSIEDIASNSKFNLELYNLFHMFISTTNDLISGIDIERFAVDISNREEFEKDFVAVFKSFHEITQHADSFESLGALFCNLLVYSYSLRQMADYEPSFDARITVRDISLLVHCIDLFVELVILLTDKSTHIDWKTSPQILQTVCAKDILPGYRILNEGEENVLFSLGGVFANARFDLQQVGRSLLSRGGYRPSFVNNEAVSPLGDNPLLIERVVPGAPVYFRIAISLQGSIFVDVVLAENRLRKYSVGDINSLAVERLLVRHIIQNEILPHCGNRGILYLGRLESRKQYEVSMFQCISDISGGALESNIRFRIRNQLRSKLDQAEIEFIPVVIRSKDDMSKRRLVRSVGTRYSSSKKVFVLVYLNTLLTALELEFLREKITEEVCQLDTQCRVHVEVIPSEDFVEMVSIDEFVFEDKVSALVESVLNNIEKCISGWAEHEVAGSLEATEDSLDNSISQQSE